MTPSNGFRDKLKPEEKKKMINSIFAFSYAWGMGGSLQDFGWERIDDVIKDVFKSVAIPSSNTVFEYYFDSKKDNIFKGWAAKVPPFVFDKDVPYF